MLASTCLVEVSVDDSGIADDRDKGIWTDPVCTVV